MALTKKSISIVRGDSGSYRVKFPLHTSKISYRDEVVLMTGVAQAMNIPKSLEDSREYGVWYGPNLGLSDDCKRGLEAIVRLRNSVVGI